MSARGIKMGDATGHVPIEVARGMAWLGALANKDEDKHQVLHSIQWGRDLKKDGGSTVLAATDTYALGHVSVRDMDMGGLASPYYGSTWLLPGEAVRSAMGSAPNRRVGLLYMEPGVLMGSRRASYEEFMDGEWPPLAFPDWRKVVPDLKQARWVGGGIPLRDLATVMGDAARCVKTLPLNTAQDAIRLDATAECLDVRGSGRTTTETTMGAAYRARLEAEGVWQNGANAGEGCEKHAMWWGCDLLARPLLRAAEIWPGMTCNVYLPLGTSPLMIQGRDRHTSLTLVVMGRRLGEPTESPDETERLFDWSDNDE